MGRSKEAGRRRRRAAMPLGERMRLCGLRSWGVVFRRCPGCGKGSVPVVEELCWWCSGVEEREGRLGAWVKEYVSRAAEEERRQRRAAADAGLRAWVEGYVGREGE